jgi:hypothetical protein
MIGAWYALIRIGFSRQMGTLSKSRVSLLGLFGLQSAGMLNELLRRSHQKTGLHSLDLLLWM